MVVTPCLRDLRNVVSESELKELICLHRRMFLIEGRLTTELIRSSTINQSCCCKCMYKNGKTRVEY